MIDLTRYQDDDFLTVTEILAWLECSRSWLYKHRRTGAAPLTFRYVGSAHGTTAREVRAWLAGR